MRILHVVTLVDDRSSYGGPLSVALGQCAELRRRDHEAVILAGWQGRGKPPTELEGVPAQLFPVRPVAPGLRFAGLVSVRMMRWLQDHAHEFDVAHIHLARDLVPLGAASVLRRAGVPYVVQTHGMVRHDTRTSARLIDRALTVPILRAAAAVCSLTSTEDADLQRVGGPSLRVTRLRNGIALSQWPPSGGRDSDDEPLDVLFLARLHPRKRVMHFARAADTLVKEGVNARFSVVGPDDGDLRELTQFLEDRPELRARLQYGGTLPHADAVARIRRADLFVLPSVGEVVPMTILESLAAGVPVICTTSCGLAGTVRDTGAGIVVEPEEQALVDALRTLTNDHSLRAQSGHHARAVAEERFSLAAVAEALEGFYRAAQTGRRDTDRSLLWLTNLATPYRLPLWRELAGHRPLIVALLADTEPNRHWKFDLDHEPFRVIRLHAPVIHSSDTLTLYAPTVALLRLLRRRPRTLVIDGWESPAYLAAAVTAKLLGIPVVASYRSTAKTHRFGTGPVALLRKMVFRCMDGVLTGGTASSDAVRAMGVDPRRISQGFNTVDVESFTKAAPARLHRAHAAGGGHRYLYVGQLIPRKNVAMLIEAFSDVAAPADKLTIIGSGPLEESLRQLVGDLRLDDRVLFVGHLDGDDLVNEYCANETLVLPSTEEVWGLVANEALAAGLHVVISDVCGAAPSIEGMPGVFVVAPTKQDLAQGMTASRAKWCGPIEDHPIREHTPRALAEIVLSAAERAIENKRTTSPA